MPHIIVEYSENLSGINIAGLLQGLHNALSEQETISKSAIKTRAILVQDCVVGEEHDFDELLHVTLKLLPGRPVALKKTMAEALYAIACTEVRAQYSQCSVTVEVIELDADTYTK